VVVVDGYNMTCTQRIKGLEVKLRKYALIDDFYVMDLADTYVVLGVQWIYLLGHNCMNYRDMRMEFKDKGGHQFILRGMSKSAPMIMSNQHMEALLRHGDVVFTTKFLITMEKPLQDRQHYPANIQTLLGKHERVFGPFPVGRPLEGFDNSIDLEEGLNPMITTT
jgi:hypothetical protein